jgi:hypothetical protein
VDVQLEMLAERTRAYKPKCRGVKRRPGRNQAKSHK